MRQAIRILFASDYLPHHHLKWGGAEQACNRLATLLSRKGHDISVLTTKPIRYREEKFNSFVSPVIEDFVPRKLKKTITDIKNTIIPYDFISQHHFKKVLHHFRPDIVHLHNFTSLSFSTISQLRNSKIPIMMSVYDYWFICPLGFLWFIDDYLNYSGSNCNRYHSSHCGHCIAEMKEFRKISESFISLCISFRKRIFDIFLRRIDGFVVLSEANARVLEDYGINKDKIFVVHIPLENGSQPVRNNIEKDTILYIGWFHPRKGMHVCVESMKYILKEKPNAKLYIVGGDSDERYKNKVLQMINKNNISRNVFILGKLPFEKVRNYLNKANVLVIPEQWETIAPNALTEGMVFGKSVVASKIGGTLDIIKDGVNGLLVRYDDPFDYSEKILSILNNENLRKQLSFQASITGKKIFSNEKVYKELLNSYHMAIDSMPS